MSSLRRYSERYQPTGGLAAEGVLNQLGRPDIEPLEVLVREAVQNCWDAGRGGGPVEVEFGYRPSSGRLSSCLREDVLPDPPPGHPLANALAEDPDLLYVADFGTSGLGGPTRADAVVDGTTDFIDFVRNVGQPPDKELGGGSYGYGKAAFYLASRARTIIVDTYSEAERERRLIAYGLGEHYRLDGLAFTGRHWWGITVEGVPEPLLGGDAAVVAAALGLPSREDGRFGTTVAIVSPYLAAAGSDEGLDPREALEFIGECLLWNFWPKITSARDQEPSMRFRLLDGEEEVRLGDPRSHSRLGPFVGAMDLLREGREIGVEDPFSSMTEIRSQKPARRLGELAVRQTPSSAEPVEGDRLLTRGDVATAGGLRHVALMRNAELVVRYEPGPLAPIQGRGYAGVFRCDPELDEVFRRSEPPTHDAWISKSLPERRERTYVNVAMRRIEGVLREMTTPALDLAHGGLGVSVGRFADRLAGLMPAMTGPGARRAEDGLTSTGGTKGQGGGAGSTNGSSESAGGVGGELPPGPRILEVGPPDLVVVEDGAVRIRTPFSLDTDGSPTRVEAVVEILTMDGGQVETEPPIATAPPAVCLWRGGGREVEGSPSITVAPTESGEWEVWVYHDPDLMVRVGIDARAEEDR